MHISVFLRVAVDTIVGFKKLLHSQMDMQGMEECGSHADRGD